MDNLNQQTPESTSKQQQPISSSQTLFHPKTFHILLAIIIVIILGLTIFLLTSTSQPPPSPTITQPSPTPDPTVNWKTYKNNTLRYSLRYPESFVFASKDPRNITISSDTVNTTNPDPSLSILDRSNAQWQTANDACEAEVCSNVNFGWKKEQARVNNAMGVKLTDAEIVPGGYEDYYLSSPDGTIIVRLIIGATNNEDFSLLKQILSTFKFTDQNLYWKKYSNKEFSFGIEYPDGWEYTEVKAGDPLHVYFYPRHTISPARSEGSTIAPFSIIVSLNSPSYDFNDLCNSKNPEPCLGKNDPENLTINGYLTKKRELPAYYALIDFLKDGYIFSIRSHHLPNDTLPEYKISPDIQSEILNHMISTFKFTQ